MQSPRIKRPSLAGFTMVEMAVVLTIVALLIGGTLVLGNVRLNKSKVEATTDRLNMIESALRDYIEINDRIPCPADGTIARNATNFGVEGATPGTCTGGAPAANYTDAGGFVVGGVLPVKTLGLPDDLMYDGWGRRITYVVDKRYTSASAFINHKQSSSCGGITIKDGSGNTMRTDGIYVVLSHGADGHGAFVDSNAAPFCLNTGNTETSAKDNAGYDAACGDVFDAIFRDRRYYVDAANTVNTYDDLIRYKSRREIVLNADTRNANFTVGQQSTPPGWVYVPESTLPDGTRVPAFEIMKYEAYDGTGDGFVDFTSGGTPANGLPYVIARSVCQRIDGDGGFANIPGTLQEYDVPSWSQWVALAHMIAKEDRNWVGEQDATGTGGCYGTNALYTGHTDNSPAAAQATGAVDSQAGTNGTNGAYLNTGNSAADASVAERAQRRTFYLPSGAVIWDLGGNASEWVYCDTPNCLITNSDGRGAYGLANMSRFTNSQIAATGEKEYSALTPDGVVDFMIPPDSFNSTQYTGTYKISSTTNESTGLLNGGDFSDTTSAAGIFRTMVGYTGTTNAGIRCVHNINNLQDYNEDDTDYGFNPNNLDGLQIWYDASDIDGDGVTEGASESDLDAACAGSPAVHDGCVQVWRNKSLNTVASGTPAATPYNNFHARSDYLNNAASTGNATRPTLVLNGIGGKPTINFAASTTQWFDTYHGIASGSDTGDGFRFDGLSQFTIFTVINGTDLDSAVAAMDEEFTLVGPYPAGYTPYGQWVLFPTKMSNHHSAGLCGVAGFIGMACDTPDDYYFIGPVFSPMASPDNANDDCWQFAADAGTGAMAFSAAYYGCAQMGGITNKINGLTHGVNHVATGVFNAGSTNGLCAYVDGRAQNAASSCVAVSSGAIGTQTPSGASDNAVDLRLIIGRGRMSAGGTFKGNLSEVLIYNRALSTQERVRVERYLAAKYGIPYKGPAVTTEGTGE